MKKIPKWVCKKKKNVQLKTICSIGIHKLSKNLAPHGYVPSKYSTGLWRHARKNICLCVDDFGVKYFYDTDADNLLNTL